MYQVMAGNVLINSLRANSPYDSGNLRYRGISDLAMANSNSVKIEIGGQNTPYALLLNNVAVIKGNTNIHFQWIEKIVDRAVSEIAAAVGGRVYTK